MTKKNTGKGTRHLHVNVKTAKGRKQSSTKWLARQLNDPYVHRAKEEGYRSRAAYKLLEIDKKFSLFSQKSNIIDLGAAPGGWTQIAVEKAPEGNVIAIDINPFEPIKGATCLQLDFCDNTAPELLKKSLNNKKADIILSDMAAPATGHTQTDHLRIVGLCELAFDFAIHNLNPNGCFVAKIFQGGTEHGLLKEMKNNFSKVKHFKPNSSRKDSAEMYVVALGFKGEHHEP